MLVNHAHLPEAGIICLLVFKQTLVLSGVLPLDVDARGVHCTKHVRVYANAQNGH